MSSKTFMNSENACEKLFLIVTRKNSAIQPSHWFIHGLEKQTHNRDEAGSMMENLSVHRDRKSSQYPKYGFIKGKCFVAAILANYHTDT